MGSKTRGYDESKSPQWKYLLMKEGQARRNIEADLRRERARAERNVEGRGGTGEGKPLTRKEKRDRRRRESKEKRFNKQGRLIVYTATPEDEAPRESWSSATGKGKVPAIFVGKK